MCKAIENKTINCEYYAWFLVKCRAPSLVQIRFALSQIVRGRLAMSMIALAIGIRLRLLHQ